MLPTEVTTAVRTQGSGQLVNPFWHLNQCTTPARGFHLLGLLSNSSSCADLQRSNLEAVGHTPIQQGTAGLPAAAAWHLMTAQESAAGHNPAVAPLLLASGDYGPSYAHNIIHTRYERMASHENKFMISHSILQALLKFLCCPDMGAAWRSHYFGANKFCVCCLG